MSDLPRKRRKLDLVLDTNNFTDPCERCQDLARLYTRDGWLAKKNYCFVMEVRESRQTLETSPCPVCRLLSTLKTDDSLTFLHALSARWLLSRLKSSQRQLYRRFNDTVVIRIDSEKNGKKIRDGKSMGHLMAMQSISELPYSILPFRSEAKTIEFDQIESWLNHCEKSHGNACQPQDADQIQPLMVIDCNLYDPGEPPKLVSISRNEKYAALSYVWGVYKNSKLAAPVVKDSIQVAKRLGCRYLWVDRHCIGQDESDEFKNKEFKKMDKIYSQAQFTIIAAAGTDSRDGLAGVTGPRQEPKSTQAKEIQFRYLGTPPKEKIQSTKWAERGWTYQEGLLSRRRIFFTDEQVIFQCNNMTCLESLRIPMER
ncbi:hypothetical protein FHETE_6909 [Fusarium heterosporum]|uniref:Heterokaryon incompatibility domain-containing protein n=1 Tax=Fusarium heterosporum TaxID=42747 RepID=A0A8H5T351_FUSHE|nr:hypothetical protein FHETE_6909 [Fusarium heterosporum]